MAQFVEFITGTWLEGLDEDVGQEASSLCSVLTQGVLDAVLALVMFEQASSTQHGTGREERERNRERERCREVELAAADPRDMTAPDYDEWRKRLSDQAKRDVVRENWVAGELPQELTHRVPYLPAHTFVRALAQVGRTLNELAKLNTGDGQAEVRAARDAFERALPSLKPVRDSVEHAEDRMRGRGRSGQKMILAPISNALVNAPDGGVLIGDSLRGNRLGWTVADGSHQEVEVSDATVEAARAAVQRALDALSWKKLGYPRYVPSNWI